MLESGPASTVGEHSLCNIFRPRGPWFDPRQGHFVSDVIYSRKFFAQMFDGNSNKIGQVLPITQPHLGKRLLRHTFYCMKGNVALKIGPV